MAVLICFSLDDPTAVARVRNQVRPMPKFNVRRHMDQESDLHIFYDLIYLCQWAQRARRAVARGAPIVVAGTRMDMKHDASVIERLEAQGKTTMYSTQIVSKNRTVP
jgi:hypothetical protein